MVSPRNAFGANFCITDKPDSPHLLIPKMKAEVLCCVADNDDKRDPGAKDTLKQAFAAAQHWYRYIYNPTAADDEPVKRKTARSQRDHNKA